MLKDLFFTYNRLFPGMGSVIMSVIDRADAEGRRLGYEGNDLRDYITGEILDVVDP